MQIRCSKLFPIAMIMVLAAMLMMGCGKQGNRFGNTPPTISITSFEGYGPDNIYGDSTAVTSFQQKIFWHATDTDGVVTGYAYRIKNTAGEYISTARNAYIDLNGDVTPQNVLEKYGPGWVLHYKAGADQDLALDNPDAKRTIWTSQKYATVNFIAADSLGNPITSISSFEVICVDNRGAICEEMAYRKFNSSSDEPTCFLSTTKGDPNGAQVGTGIKLSFTLDDTDLFLQPTAWYYEFQINKMDNTTHVAVSPVDTTWYSTKDLENINVYKLTKHTTPSLSSDYNSAGTQLSYTQVIAKVIDLAGIKSESDTIKFVVKEGFHPKTVVYEQRTYAVGTNHFIDYADESSAEIWPYTVADNEQLFATYFFKDKNGDFTVVDSPNLKSWIRWGWHGEFAKVTTVNGITNYDYSEDNPYYKKVDMLLDEATDKNYYSEVTHFDIRLDGLPYYYPPLATSIFHDPISGLDWLRVPVNSSLGQTIVLANLDPGNHVFEVRAVDLQDEPDPTPAVFDFNIVPPVEKAMKSGVLIIDDDTNHNQYSPAAVVDTLWANYFAGTGYTPDVMHYADLVAYKNRKLALSDIQAYKLVIFHSERTDQPSNLDYENDCLALYLKQGGNMLVTSTGKSKQTFDNFYIKGYSTLNEYFGIPYANNISGSITSNSNPYFIGATGKTVGTLSYNSIPLKLPGFNAIVNNAQGLYSVTYFTFLGTITVPGLDVIYGFGCKPTTAPVGAPNQTNFNLLNNQPVGIRKVTENNYNKCYLLGFPLSYMDDAEAKSFIDKVLADVM
jgi:hypothetical protein